MSGASPLQDRIDSLTAVGDWLRRRGRLALWLGFAAVPIGCFLWWPDPAANGAFTGFALVPGPLNQHLADSGAAIRNTPMGFLWAGGRLELVGFQIWVFLAGCALIRRFVKWRWLRWQFYMAAPIWMVLVLAFGSQPFVEGTSPSTARSGVVVDHAGAPPAKADGTDRSAVPAYHLQPERLPPLLADQGRYVLAQQAYFDQAPARAAMHLRAMTGAWQPREMDRERIGILDQWASAAGADVGPTARSLGGGGPWAHTRRLLAMLAFAVAALVVVAGFVLDVTGSGRSKRARALSARIAGLVPASAPPAPAARHFGRRGLVAQ